MEPKLKKYFLYSLSFHALVITLLLLFGGEGPPPPPPKTQVTMIRLSRGAGDLNAPLFQKPAFQPKPTEPQPAPPQPAAPPIPVAKPAPVVPAKPITPPAPAKPPTPVQPTVHLGKDKTPPKPQPAKPAQPQPPAQPAAPAPDEAKLAEALGQVQKELEQREVTAQTPPAPAGAPDGSGSGAPAGVPGGQIGAADPGLAQYQSTVRSKIVRTWVRANTGPDDGQAIRTRVQVRINASGQVIGKNVVKSSGNESFDLSALRAIERASPLPPPPPGLEAEALSEGFVVDFSSRMLGRK
ncbi:MAG TPA: energy transducer TonB [bacterium]|nr:energy transducer TonB [bacterium]